MLGSGFEGVQEHTLVFKRPPQALDEDIVHPATTTVHRDGDAREKGLELTEETVDLSTLAAICAEHVPPASPIHFLKVDVEGFERAVLAGNDWKRFRPGIIVVEATLPNSQVECHEEWDEIVASADYLFAYADGLNRYYVAREHQELVSSFKFPPNVFDQFAPASLAAALKNLEQSEAALRAAQLQVEAERQNSTRIESELRSALRRAQEYGEHRQAEPQRRLESTERLLEESQKRVEGLEQHLIAYRERERESRTLVTEAKHHATIAAERYDAIFLQHQAILEQHRAILQQHEAILKSTSWRLTAPLRTLVTLLPKSLRARLD